MLIVWFLGCSSCCFHVFHGFEKIYKIPSYIPVTRGLVGQYIFCFFLVSDSDLDVSNCVVVFQREIVPYLIPRREGGERAIDTCQESERSKP
jgi:hypothetical protein